jgi:hypothetical protein
VADARAGDWFPGVGTRDAAGKFGPPLELLMLGALTALGRYHTYDAIADSCNTGREVHRKFFPRFVSVGRRVLFPLWVPAPTDEAIRSSATTYALAGMDGCVASGDATHVLVVKAPAGLKNVNYGKEGNETRAFQIWVTHDRRILASTTGSGGSYNDKTIIRNDAFAMNIRERKTFADHTYNLFDSDGKVTEHKGVWMAVDGGYHRWKTTIPPMKDSSDVLEQRFSKWLEAMRKDVECTFGILKSRWTILKTGIRTHDLEMVNDVWFTCCALHNMLLAVDGLDQAWENGVPSMYEEQHDEQASGQANTSSPAVFGRFAAARQGSSKPATMTGVECDRDFLSHRRRLVENFDYRYRHDLISWPTRNGQRS